MKKNNCERLMIIDCMDHMSSEEKNYYQEHNASEYFYYIYGTKQFQESLKRLGKDDLIYLFEKFYLVTYKSLNEEKDNVLLDRVLYLISRMGVFFTKKGTPMYNEFYKLLQISQATFLEKRVNDDLLLGLELVMGSCEEKDFNILLGQHQEASVFRNHRDYLYEEDAKAKDGELPEGEIIAINCFNRSYQREKELVLKY